MPIRITEVLAQHMITVYRAMYEDSEEQEDHRIYVGKLSGLIRDLGISGTYYSKIFRALYEGGYAALEDRGGRSKPSTVILLREPTIEELTALTLTNPGPILSLVKRMEAIEASLGGIYVVGAFKEVERRLVTLEEAESARVKGRSSRGKKS